MTATDVWDGVATESKVERDRYGRPLIVPAKGGKAKPYTRVTTIANTLDDRYNLELWGKRQTAIGLMLRPDLLALVAAQQNDKDALNKTVQQAIDASKAGAAANTGTALHALIERTLSGEDLSHIPADLRADVAACVATLERHGFEIVHTEQLVVCEQIEAAGTPDLILKQGDRYVVGDWKTGAGAVDWGMPGIAIQTGIYTRAETMYDPATRTHTPMPTVDMSRAYVFHAPAGSGRCDVVEVDVGAGWQAAQLAMSVRAWRQRKDLGRSVTDAAGDLMFQREAVAVRIRALPQGAVDALARMARDAELPRVSQSAAAHLEDWATLLTLIEAEFEVPFEPKTPATRKKAKT